MSLQAAAAIISLALLGCAPEDVVRSQSIASAESDDDVPFHTQIERLRQNPPNLSRYRMVEGYETGRCLLEVDDVIRISGPCYYREEPNGSLYIAGPRQVFEGVDYTLPHSKTVSISTDWWANVYRSDGAWTGYGNEEIEWTNGQGSRWGELEREGSCFSNLRVRKNYEVGDFHPDYAQKVKLCLWKG